MKGFPNAFRNSLLTGDVNLVTDTVTAGVLDLGAFTPTTAMDFRNDITAGIVAEATVTGKVAGSLGTGIWSHSDVVFTSVTGATFEQLYYYKNTGVTSTSNLIIWNDAFTPVVPNGENITLIAASGVFQINQAV
jgi:hypothetical protein